ncbi:MAG: HEPN domain-containing protein [bacterium]
MSDRFAELEPQLDRIAAKPADVEALLARMEKDLRTAEKLRNDDPAWALTIAHQSIYNGCIALMAAHGYRPRINGHHRTAIQFARLALPGQAALLRQADLLRRERHRAVYGGLHAVPLADVDASLQLARQVLPVLKEAALEVLGEGKAREENAANKEKPQQ